MTTDPTTELDRRYGDSDDATPWATGRGVLESAPLSWLTTIRADGRPHVTPLLTVWLDGALHFCTGPQEQKARNLEAHRQVAVTTRSAGDLHLDVVVDGDAVRVTDTAVLQRLAAAWVDRHGEEWRFEVRDDVFWHEPGGDGHVFAVRPRVAWGFSTDVPFSQTRWTF